MEENIVEDKSAKIDLGERILEEKKEKLRSFLKNRYNFFLAGVLAFAFVLRAYFLYVAKDQAHWWDTLAYAGIAKNMVFGLWTENWFIISETLIRPPLLPLIWSALMRLNIGDFGMLILIEFIPSMLSVLLIYLIGKELYDEKVGLISAFMAAVAWIHLFYSVRIMTDIPSLFLALASIYFFVKSYENFELKYFSLSILFLSLAILMRYSYGLIGFVYLIFLGLVHRHRVLGKKNFWIGSVIGVVPLLIFFASNLIKYGGLFPAVESYAAAAAEKPVAFYVFGFIPYILKNTFTGLFLIGLAIVIFELFIGLDAISKFKRIKSDVFLIVMLLVSLIFFVFVIKAAEDRYLMMIFPPMFVFSSIALLDVYNFAGKYSKAFAVILVLGILGFGAYSQITFGNMIIEDKKTSFLPMKEALVWIGENTPEDAVILGQWADPYTIYYAGRRVEEWPRPLDGLDSFEPKADYLIVNIVHPPDDRVTNYIQEHLQDRANVVKVFYFDEAKQNPAVIASKLNKLAQ